MPTADDTHEQGRAAFPEARFYEELRALAAYHMTRERRDHTLQPTALAHEVLLRLSEQSGVNGFGRARFMSVASEMIRRILVDHARGRATRKRGGGRTHIELDEVVLPSDCHAPIELLDLDEVLSELTKLNPRQARIVELKFFGGLTLDEIAESLGVSRGTVKGDWRIARAWLRVRLKSKHGPDF